MHPTVAASNSDSLKIMLIGTDVTGVKVPATRAAAARPNFKKSIERRRVKHRSLPTAATLAKMPLEHKGPCCGGTKQWGDGKGSEAFKDGLTFICHACMVELEIPAWALLDFASEAEAAEFVSLHIEK